MRKLSEVKSKILTNLSSGDWVSSEELLKLTGQKYFDRRIRELRDENGYDIEMSHVNGSPHYRLRSKELKPPLERTYLSATEKKEFYRSNAIKCNLCSHVPEKNEPKLVFDHRIPLLRGGPGKIENFQLLCRTCNNQKRSFCRDCIFDCNKCYFAYPEKFPQAIVLNFPSKEVKEKIEIYVQKHNLSIHEFILNVLMKEIDGQDA